MGLAVSVSHWPCREVSGCTYDMSCQTIPRSDGGMPFWIARDSSRAVQPSQQSRPSAISSQSAQAHIVLGRGRVDIRCSVATFS